MNPEPLIMAEDLRFIRTQEPAAVPLLAELYAIPIARVQLIRMQRAHGEKMPIRLIRELVAQRKEKLDPEEYVSSESSIVLCADV